MGWESSGVVRFDLGPLLQGQMRIAKLKSAYTNFFLPVSRLSLPSRLPLTVSYLRKHENQILSIL